MEVEQFYMMPKRLCRANGFFSKESGDAIQMTSSMKLVYMYMVARNDFFVNKQSSTHYESQATIAENCGLEYKAVGKILRTFVLHKVLEATKLRPNGEGQWRWVYHKVDKDIKLWQGNKEKPEMVEDVKSELKVKQKVKIEEELDLPY